MLPSGSSIGLSVYYRGETRRYLYIYICVCVCVFFPSILDIKFVGRTSRGHTGGRSHRISHPPSFCGACLNFSREKDSATPFPRRPWSRILCTNDLIVLHPLGIFILFYSFLVRKIPFAGIELTSQRVRGLRGTSELPGRPIYYIYIYISFFYLISLIADGPNYYHPACGHKGSSHLSPVHALQFIIAMQAQHSYNSSTSGWILLTHVPTLSVTKEITQILLW